MDFYFVIHFVTTLVPFFHLFLRLVWRIVERKTSIDLALSCTFWRRQKIRPYTSHPQNRLCKLNIPCSNF